MKQQILNGAGIVVTCLFFQSCTHAPTPETRYPISRAEQVGIPHRPAPAQIEIDMAGLQNTLRLTRQPEVLGFTEKQFNSCQVDHGFSSTDDCKNYFYSVVHFKLMCRDSEGTVTTQLNENELQPVVNQELVWQLKNLRGQLRTDSSGYGQIVAITAASVRQERFRLSSAKDFLLMRAEDIKRLIVPKNWCE